MKTINIWFGRLARRRWLSIALPAVLVVLIRLAILPWYAVPEPYALDEFSQLLAAKTFASGEWSAPAHPMWMHFEAPYIINQPSYASKYPPGPPAFLALGIALFGHPWAAVLLSVGLMCAAACWLLQGWVPLRWALAGALLVAAKFSLHHHWVNSYFCAAYGAFGGMLVLGALPRLLRTRLLGYALIMGLGFAIVISARPYEGLVFSSVPGIAVMWWAISGSRLDIRRKLVGAVLPIGLIVISAVAIIGYYNRQVTGSALKLPYTVHTEKYEPVPHFIWQSVKAEPVYNHQHLRDFYDWPGQLYGQRTVSGFTSRVLESLGLWIQDRSFLQHPRVLTDLAFGLVVVGSLFCLARDKRMRIPLIMLGVMIAGLLVETWYFDRYAAPFVGLTVLLVVQGLRHISVWGVWRRGIGCALPVLLLLFAFSGVAAYSLVFSRLRTLPADDIRIDLPRARAQISGVPGRHLVLVRYSPAYSLHSGDWVYNEPDIDSARIVWARDMGPKRNADLLEYFKDRQIWGVCKGNAPARIYRGRPCPEPFAKVEEPLRSSTR